MPVVTIARETGAGGAEVGRLLADRLRADLVDGSLIDEVARRLQLPREDVEERDEQPRSSTYACSAGSPWRKARSAPTRPSSPMSRPTPTTPSWPSRPR
jgi:hypothetical protein